MKSEILCDKYREHIKQGEIQKSGKTIDQTQQLLGIITRWGIGAQASMVFALSNLEC